MASDIDICNLALGHLRAGTINSLTESSVQARQCKLRYPLLRDQMLQDSPWQFATSVKPLPLLVAEGFGWAYVYSYPTDCLRINRILPEYLALEAGQRSYYPYGCDDRIRKGAAPVAEYKVYDMDGSKVILANLPNLRIEYRKSVTNTTLYSNNFIMALSHLMASEMAVSLVGADAGRALRADELSLYTRYLNAGVVNELNEQKAEIAESDFITVRN